MIIGTNHYRGQFLLEAKVFIAIFSAVMICAASMMASVFVIKKAMRRSWDSFSQMVFGSMAMRIVLVLILFWAGIVLMELPALAFGLTILIASFIFTIIEVVYLNRLAKRTEKTN